MAARGLDFARAPEVFEGLHLTREDARHDELRYQVIGWLDGRLVMAVWTPRGTPHHFNEAHQWQRAGSNWRHLGLTQTTDRR